MNERIRSLAEQAGLRFTQQMSNPMVPVVDGRETDLEKFAQLIVQECLELCKYPSEEEDDDDQFDLGMMYKSREIKTLVKKHFGVEV